MRYLVCTEQIKGQISLTLSELFNDELASTSLPRLDPESPIALFPTSGSTGESKYVPHSHHDAIIIGQHLKQGIAYEENDVIYTERRMSWIGGFPFMYLHDGVKVVTKTLWPICFLLIISTIKSSTCPVVGLSSMFGSTSPVGLISCSIISLPDKETSVSLGVAEA